MGPVLFTSRQKLLLLFLSVDEDKLDPIRIQKGMFIFGQEAPKDWIPPTERYKFVPYNFGPCSFELYDDLSLLEVLGFLNSEIIPGKSWNYYSLTKKGKGIIPEIMKSFPREAYEFMIQIRQFLKKVTFEILLKAVYKAYPKYAEKSVFKNT
jgi:hypothetical protein